MEPARRASTGVAAVQVATAGAPAGAPARAGGSPRARAAPRPAGRGSLGSRGSEAAERPKHAVQRRAPAVRPAPCAGPRSAEAALTLPGPAPRAADPGDSPTPVSPVPCPKSPRAGR